MTPISNSGMNRSLHPSLNSTNHRGHPSVGVDVDDDRLVPQQERERIIKVVEQASKAGGTLWINVISYWNGELRWARNRASMTSDRRDIVVSVFRGIKGGLGRKLTNQTDSASLTALARAVEWEALKESSPVGLEKEFRSPEFPRLPSTTWSDATMAKTVEDRARLVEQVTNQSEEKQLFSSGYMESRGVTWSRLRIDQYGKRSMLHANMTQAQCSVTVRHPKGTGSGWAGLSSYDLAKIDEADIAKRALDKCMISLDPVRIEPGRYTTILEPQAVADMMRVLLGGGGLAFYRPYLPGPFFLGIDAATQRIRTKLGLKIADERITISHDPEDPQLGVVTEPGVKPITWIENGILKTLEDEPGYARNDRNEYQWAERRISYRMSGGNTTMEEMIATTKRGLIVTRLSSIQMVDEPSLLTTGLTRDGLWLVENGKITKAVKNFRFTESPLFMLNNIDQLGVPVPIFNPSPDPLVLEFLPIFAGTAIIVPPMKVNDFSFTSTIDAI